MKDTEAEKLPVRGGSIHFIRGQLLSGGRVMRLEEQTSMLGEDEEEE